MSRNNRMDRGKGNFTFNIFAVTQAVPSVPFPIPSEHLLVDKPTSSQVWILVNRPVSSFEANLHQLASCTFCL